MCILHFVSVLLTLLISVILSNISFIELSSLLSGYPASSFNLDPPYIDITYHASFAGESSQNDFASSEESVSNCADVIPLCRHTSWWQWSCRMTWSGGFPRRSGLCLPHRTFGHQISLVSMLELLRIICGLQKQHAWNAETVIKIFFLDSYLQFNLRCSPLQELLMQQLQIRSRTWQTFSRWTNMRRWDKTLAWCVE